MPELPGVIAVDGGRCSHQLCL